MTMRARFVVQNLSRLNGWQIEIYRSTVNAKTNSGERYCDVINMIG